MRAGQKNAPLSLMPPADTMAMRRSKAPPLRLLILTIALAMSAFPRGARATVRAAVIGDFGDGSSREAAVATLVQGWDTAGALGAVVTSGDNCYPSGSASCYANNVGPYYAWAIAGSAAANRFWPCPGNHDWGSSTLSAYLAYFTALNNKYYYDVQANSSSTGVHFFLLDSDPHEADGITAGSTQAAWLAGALAASAAPFKIVLLHHPPYSSGSHGSTAATQWPFEDLGADAVIAGHDHHYERLSNPRGAANRAGFPYFVNGAGGASLYATGVPLASSVVRYNARPGAQLLTARAAAADNGATRHELDFSFVNADGAEIDCYRITKVIPAGGGAPLSTAYSACTASGGGGGGGNNNSTDGGGGSGGGSSATYSLLTQAAAEDDAGPAEVSWRYKLAPRRDRTSSEPGDDNGGSSGAPLFAAAGFDDSKWRSGAAPLGAGKGGLSWATRLARRGKRARYYFRARACLSSAAAAQLSGAGAATLRLALPGAGAATVYMNGQLAYTTTASSGGSSSQYWTHTAALAPGALGSGANVIAVRLDGAKGARATGFDLDLVYSAAAPLAAEPLSC